MLSIQIVAVIKDMLVEYENMLVDGWIWEGCNETMRPCNLCSFS